MDAPNGYLANPPEGPNRIQLLRVDSATFRRPSLHLLEDTREGRIHYLNLCVPLYKYALEGNWEKAKPMLLSHERMLMNAAIAKGYPTVLHVAAGAGHFSLVKELVNLMNESDLDLQDSRGNNAFCFAAVAGNLDIAELMWEKNPFLLNIRGGNGFTPLHFAAIQGRADMTWYLYSKIDELAFEEADRNKLFLTCIDSGIYDLALKMLKDKQELALATNEEGMTGLHIMAQKTTDLGHHSPEHQNLISSDEDEGNNILHLAAKLAPTDGLELVSGAAFQMKLELLWFDEVKIMLPSYVKKKNSNGETPRDFFTREHASLRKDAESWTKRTADSCMVVSTLIATGVFSAAFSIPGGINDNSGTPSYLWKRSFMIFAM